MDQSVFFWINSFAGRNSWFDNFGIFLAVGGIFILCGWAIILFLDRRLKTNVIVAIASAVVSRLVIVEPIKQIVNRSRPYEVFHVHLLVADGGTGQAFPSGHAVIMFAVALAFYRTKWFCPMMILATLSSLARIFIGVHYPSDILASFFIDGLTVWA